MIVENKNPKGMQRANTGIGVNVRKEYKSMDGINKWFIDKRGIYKLRDDNGLPDWKSAYQCSELPMSAIEQSRHVRQEAADSITLSKEEMYDKFVWFIKERESIRVKKESNEPRPWTEDEVLDKTKFTNIFRQDDRVSKFIYKKVEGLTGDRLVYNLLVGRLLNRTDILDKALPCKDSLTHLIEGDNPKLMNASAYQISPGLCRKSKWNTNREYVIHETPLLYKGVYEAITSTTDIKEAVDLGNKAYGGSIPFTMFQVILDYHFLTNHFNDFSDILIGQGAKPILDVIGDIRDISKSLSVDTGLHFNTWDTEHAACEFRKYLYRQDKVLSRYSYKPNSMGVVKEHKQISILDQI